MGRRGFSAASRPDEECQTHMVFADYRFRRLFDSLLPSGESGRGAGGEGARHLSVLAKYLQRIHLTGDHCIRFSGAVTSHSVHWTRRVQRLCRVPLAPSHTGAGHENVM